MFGGGGWRVQKEATISYVYGGSCSSKILVYSHMIMMCLLGRGHSPTKSVPVKVTGAYLSGYVFLSRVWTKCDD